MASYISSRWPTTILVFLNFEVIVGYWCRMSFDTKYDIEWAPIPDMMEYNLWQAGKKYYLFEARRRGQKEGGKENDSER